MTTTTTIRAEFQVRTADSTDPAKLVETFEQYLRDMLYVGVDDEEDDPFWVDEVSVQQS